LRLNFLPDSSSPDSLALSQVDRPKNPLLLLINCGLLGILASLAFAPANLWPAILFAQIGLLYFLQPAHFVVALSGLWTFWALHFGTAMHWMYLGLGKILGLGSIAAVSLTIVSGLVYSAILLVPWLLYCLCPANSRLRLACFPLAWVLCEWMRYWILGGLTWLLSGYALLPSWLTGWVPIFGALGAGLAACLSAVLFYTAVKKKFMIPLAGVLVLWAGGGLLSGINWTQSMGASIPATIVQPEAKAWLQEAYSAEERDQIWNREVSELSDGHWQPGLLVWPERGIRASVDYSAGRIYMLAQKARASDTALITGANHYAGQPGNETYNAVYGLGTAEGLYFKEKLVPLGERTLPGSTKAADLEEEQKLSTKATTAEDKRILFDYEADRFSIAPLICYEIAWGNYLNTFADDANILVNLSNDRWFTQSPQLDQTLQIARTRAIEQQKPLLRSSFGGYSAHINHKGDIIAVATDTSAQTLSTTVEPRSGYTPYTRAGDIPVLVLALLIWLGALLSTVRIRHPGNAVSPATNGAKGD
jgi:apolipoprotein N-acyltransferase